MLSTVPIFEKLFTDQGWDEDNKLIYYISLVNMPILGLMLANYTYHGLFSRWKPYDFIFKLKLLLICFIAMMLVNNIQTSLIGRFLLGLNIGYQSRSCEAVMDQLMPKTHRDVGKTLNSLMYTAGFIICFYLAHTVVIDYFSWRVFYIIFIGIAIFDFMVFTCFISVDISPLYQYYKHGRKKAKKLLDYYLNPQAVEELLDEHKVKSEALKKIHKKQLEENMIREPPLRRSTANLSNPSPFEGLNSSARKVDFEQTKKDDGCGIIKP